MDIPSDSDIDDTVVDVKTTAQSNSEWPDTLSTTDKHNTIFVRNLPYSYDDAKLTKLFTDYKLSVKRAFVVVQRRSQISRGFGFVTFHNATDIETAIEKLNNTVIDGRTLLLDIAKPDKAPYKEKSIKTDNDSSATAAHHTVTQQNIENCTLLVSHIPLNTKSLDEYITSLHGIQSILFPSIESTKQSLCARIQFDTVQNVQHALQYFNEKCKIKSVPTHAIQLNTKQINKLIVRNLSFTTTQQQLQSYFSTVGVITSVTLPLKPGTHTHRGFGFVVYNTLSDAQKAIDTLNGTLFNGRKIAVDFSVDKNTYMNTLDDNEKQKLQETQKKLAEATEKAKLKEQRRLENIANRDKKRALRGEITVKTEDDTEITDNTANKTEDSTMNDDSVKSEDVTDNDNDNDSSDDDMNDTTDIAQPSPEIVRPTNVTPDATIFIRNVSYDTTEQQLSDLFTTYGPVKMAKIVIDKQYNRPKGTAFVQFYSHEIAEHVVSIASKGNPENDMLLTNAQRKQQYNKKTNKIVSLNTDGIQLNGRTLHCVLAVSRDTAHKLETSDEALKRKDKRNLYLMNEGYIAPDSEVAKLMNKNDLAKRLQMYQDKKTKLKNVNYSISRTRLSIRNLPITCDEKQLKQICYTALKSTTDVGVDLTPTQHIQPLITQCKIARSIQKFDANGLGKSKRYGFVEYNEHLYSLKTLRILNNNPTIFTASQRPIVEFALVDARKAYIAQQKLLKLQAAQKGDATDTVTDNKQTNGIGKQATATERPQKRKRQPRRAPLSALNKNRDVPDDNTKQTHETNKDTTNKPVTKKQKTIQSDTAPITHTANKPVTPDTHTIKPTSDKSKKIKPTIKQKFHENKKEFHAEQKFESLVAQYKNKLFGDDTKKPVTTRWYDTGVTE